MEFRIVGGRDARSRTAIAGLTDPIDRAGDAIARTD
jgi:hypothetical protein